MFLQAEGPKDDDHPRPRGSCSKNLNIKSPSTTFTIKMPQKPRHCYTHEATSKVITPRVHRKYYLVSYLMGQDLEGSARNVLGPDATCSSLAPLHHPHRLIGRA